MTSLSLSLSSLIVIYLFVSAGAKVVRPAASTSALVDLGVPHNLAALAVAAAVAAEGAVATAIVVLPRSGYTTFAWLSLFGIFALPAIVALARDVHIECGCVGSLRSSELGRAQIAQLAAVVPIALFVAHHAPAFGLLAKLQFLSVLQLIAAAILISFGLPSAVRIRRDRRSLGSLDTWVSPTLTRLESRHPSTEPVL